MIGQVFSGYSEYKDSGIDWLGNIPKHWEVKKLKYVAPISDKKLDKKPDDVTYLGLENIESKTSRLLLDNPIEEVESAVNYFQKGNILFGKLRPYLAKVAYPDFSGVCTTELLVLNPNHNLFGKYLSYQMLADGFIDLVNSMTYGTKMPRANAEQIQNIEISFPSFSEQKQIATFLDRATTEIDQIIEQQKQLITLLEEERTTVISHTVTKGLDPSVPMKDSGIEWLGEIPKHWEAKRVKYFFVLQRGFDLPREDMVEGDYPVYGSNGIIGFHNKFTVKAPSITVGRSGSVGEINYIEEDFWAHNTALYIKHFYKAFPRFVYYLLSILDIKYLSSGSAVGTLNRNYIHDLVIAIPSYEEQREIVNYITQETARIDEAIDNVRSQIEKLEEYRTVLISDAVTGKIDVRGFS